MKENEFAFFLLIRFCQFSSQVQPRTQEGGGKLFPLCSAQSPHPSKTHRPHPDVRTDPGGTAEGGSGPAGRRGLEEHLPARAKLEAANLHRPRVADA